MRVKLHAPSSGARVVVSLPPCLLVADAAARAAAAAGLRIDAARGGTPVLALDGYQLADSERVADVVRDGDALTVAVKTRRARGDDAPSSPSPLPSASDAGAASPSASDAGAASPVTPACPSAGPDPAIKRSRSTVRKSRKRAARRRAAADSCDDGAGRRVRPAVTRPAALAAAAAAPALRPFDDGGTRVAEAASGEAPPATTTPTHRPAPVASRGVVRPDPRAYAGALGPLVQALRAGAADNQR